MKLHLPYKLRKSLLACLAAVALPTTLSTTVGTTSGLAAVWFAASGGAQAAVPPQTPEASDDELLSMDDLMLIADGAVTWTTTESLATLTWDASSDGWTTGNTFATGDNVSFLGVGGTVTVGSAVTAGSLTIGDANTAGNNAVFTLTVDAGSAATNTVTVSDTVTVNAGYSLNLDNVILKVTGLGKVTGIDRITGTGTLNVVLSANGETPTTATTLNVNTTISKGDGVDAASLTLNSGKGITLAAGKTLTIGNGVTVMVNDANLFTLQGSGDGQAKIVLEEGAVLDVGGTLSRLKGNTWFNISGEGDVYHLSTGNIGAKNISFDTNYHVAVGGGSVQHFQGVGSITVRDFILDGSFDFDDSTTVSVRGLIGKNAQDTVSAFGTWTFENNTDESKQYAGTFKSNGRNGNTGAKLTKKGTGTQEIGTLGNFASMDVQAGKMKLNAITLDASYASTITLASGATLDLSGATSFSVTGNKLTINVTTADGATDGVFASGKLLLNDTIFTALSEAATGGKLSLTLTGLTEEAAQSDGGWACDLFAGSSFTTTDSDALGNFLREAMALDWFNSRTTITVDTATGRVTFVQGTVEEIQVTVSGGAQNLTWKDNSQIVPDGETFTNEKSVIFTNNGSDPAVVTMEGTLVTSNFTVAAGQWTFKNSDTAAPTLTIEGEVSVAAGSLVLWETLEAVTIFGNSIIEGTWTGTNMTVTLGDARATAVSDITMEVGGDSAQSSVDVASIVTAEGDHAPTTHLVVTGQGHLTVGGDVNVVDVSVGNVQPEVSAAEGSAGSQLVTGNLTLSGSSSAAANPVDVLRVGTDGTVTASGTLTSTGANASITVDGGTLVVGTAPEGDPGTPGLVLKMQRESGILNVTNGGSLSVYGNVSSDLNDKKDHQGIKSFIMSGNETTVDVHGSLYAYNASVNGGMLTVDGRIGLPDTGFDAELVVVGGGSAEVGYLRGHAGGHAGYFEVGSVESAGALTITGVQDPDITEVVKAKGFKVQNGDSEVNVTGNVNLYNSTVDGGDYAVEIDAGSVRISGYLKGNNGAMNGIHVTGGGSLEVKGNVNINTGKALNIENGTVTLSGGLTASSATLAAGSLVLSGDVNVPTITLNGGTATMQAVNVTENGAWTVNGGILDLTTAGALTVTEGKALTIKVPTSGDTAGGKLRLTDAVMEELLGLKTGNKLTLNLEGLGTDAWEYALFDVTELEGWTTDAAKTFVEGMLELGTGTLSVSNEGVVSWERGSRVVLVWNTANDDNTWGEGHNNWGETNQAWTTGSDAVFSDDAGETVTIEGSVAPGNMSVGKGTWIFTGDALSVTGSITVGDVGTAAHVTFNGAVSSKGLTLQGEGTTVKFTGTAKKDFGGTTDSPSIHLGAGTELIVSGTPGGWKGENGALPNYAEGEGSIVMEGTGEVINAAGTGFLFSFVEAGDANMNKSIGALRLRSNEGGKASTLVMSGEMAGANIQNTGHSLGYFKEIFIEKGCTLSIKSGALGYKKHEGNKLHLAGTGSGEAGALIIDYDASGDKAPNQQINWDIVADADALISVVKGKTFNGTLGAQGNTLTLKTAEGQTTTLVGAFTAGDKNGTKGTLELSGGTVVLGEGFSMANSEGTLKVSGGTVSSGQAVALGNVALNGGTLTLSAGGTASSLSGSGALQVTGGTLTLGTADGAILTNLALTGNLTVNGGSFTISGGWTWGDNSKLTLSSKGQQITLDGITQLNGGNSGSQLTIDLTQAFLGGKGSGKGSVQLFTSALQESWVDYFTFTVEGEKPGVGNYDELTLHVDGSLTWGKVAENLYWGSRETDDDITWGGTEGGNFADLPGNNYATEWQDGANVYFSTTNASEHQVKLADNIITGTFDVNGSERGDTATYTFQSVAPSTSYTLDVTGGMTATNSNLAFSDDVDLLVEGGVSLTDSTMSVGDMGVKTGGVALDNSTLIVTGEADIAGALTGGNDSTLKADGGHVTLHGSVAGFSGKLDIGAGGTITLSEDAVSGDVGVTAVGSGTLAVDGGEADVTFSGTVDGVILKNAGIGELTVTSQANNGKGAKLDGGKGGITLRGTGDAVEWNGTEVTGGDITLANVTLTAEGGFTTKAPEAKVYVDTASAVRAVSEETAGGIVDVGGMDAANLDGIKVNAHGLLTNVSGTYNVSPDRQLTLHFTEDNLGEEGAGLIAGNEGFTVELQGGDAAQQGLHLEFDEVEIIEALRESGDAGTLYLRALSGGTWNAKAAGVTVDWEEEGGLMDILVSAYEFTEDGLTITGSTRDIYIVMDGEHSDSATSNSPADLAEKLATVVTKGKTLTLNWSGVGTVRNLLGEENSHLVINDSDGQGLTVTLDNTYYKTIHDDRYPGDVTEAQGMDTEFGGTITGGKGVNIVKSGLGTLTVGGDYSVVGDTRIADGALHLKGAENTLGSLTFAAGEGEKRELQLEGGKTSVGGITTGEGVTGAALKLTGGAELTLTGTSSMADAAISSEDNSGKLKLGKGASLTFTEGKGITGTAVEMKEAELDMGATQSTLTSLNGSGTLKSASGGTVTVGGGEFTGTLTGTGGTLVLKDKATFTLNNATGTGMNVKLGAGASLLVDVGEKTGASGETLVLGNIELGDGSMKVDYGKNGIGPNFVQGNISSVGTGTLEFHSDGPIANGKVETGFTLGTGDWQDFLDGIKYTGVGNFVKDHVAERGENDKLVLNMTDAKENKFEREIPGAGKNAHAGAQMLWESLRELTLGDALFAVFANPTSDYARLVFALVQDIDNGQTTGLERTLTSVAGASISTLTPALAQDIHRQLTTIRNRTTGMSADVPTDGYDEFPFWHAWIQAEGGYHKMDADGTEPGFTLHNWGGTVGVDADISRATTMGLAMTAMYGDLKPDAADSATGDLDTVYLSAFARTMRGAWSHTFVLSGGIAEAKLDRTVSYNGGSYRTRGDTDGYVVGALYEVGYTRLANKEGTVALQPIANVELRHTSLRGYTEKGSDAGVDVDDMDMTVLTLGAGARVQAAVGENAFNRSSVLEARLLAKADIGDRSGTATNAIVGHSKRAEVESAEVGAVGIETGVGISIPLGSQSGSIFADASLEWRDNWVSTNATLGYRINF